MPIRAPVVSAWLIRPMVLALRSRGELFDLTLRAAGLAPGDVDHPTGHLPRDGAIRLLEAAVATSGDPTFALTAASLYQPGANVFDYAGVTSPTVGAALGRIVRYVRLVDEGLLLRLEVGGGLASMLFEARGGVPLPPVLAEYAIAVSLVAARQWVGSSFPVEARFCHPRPGDTQVHERVLSGSLAFDCSANAIVFPAAALTIPLRSFDPDLLPVLDAQASRLLALGLREALPIDDRVRELLRSELADGTPTAARVATSLRLSERTLRRRLSERNTSVKELLDALRRDLSFELLASPGATVESVALQLGFSDATAFHRAFRRWTGKTPGEHLRQTQ